MIERLPTKDGTTDVTRTVHFGSPTQQQVEAYTRVLQGQLDFADVVFPANSGTSLGDIEILARNYQFIGGYLCSVTFSLLFSVTKLVN
ncbi:Xaa-Pro aminopeptidase 2 [Portunus trituberculatus]|uniref:Xaa-Pro aminopeptidase 2 n=1 Tax=Portunus trituberculatus TaxID=210409 RepID=A0A5B7CVQ4_PORTR|nr:Xaa-Pro aminopeptidase 2 [Portunus trituberculatus]